MLIAPLRSCLLSLLLGESRGLDKRFVPDDQVAEMMKSPGFLIRSLSLAVLTPGSRLLLLQRDPDWLA